MAKNAKIIWIIALIFVLSLQAVNPELTFAAGKITVGWAWTEGASSLTYINQLNNTKNMDIVSPTGIYLVDGEGTLQNLIGQGVVNAAHGKGIQVWALFANKNFSKSIAHEVLIDPAKRAKVISEVTYLADVNNYDGINIDWEGMYAEDRDLFTQFVRELAVSLKARNKSVSVDVTPQTESWDMGKYSNWVYCYDRKSLGESVDYVALMAYDEHNHVRPEGSVTSLPWVEESIKFLLKDVPAGKVILGIPFYTHDWSSEYSGGSQYIGMNETERRLKTYNASVNWDTTLGQNIATYYKNNVEHRIWVEDDQSLALKVDLIHKHGLAGIAAWSLGDELSTTWDIISVKMGKAAASRATPLSVSSAKINKVPELTPQKALIENTPKENTPKENTPKENPLTENPPKENNTNENNTNENNHKKDQSKKKLSNWSIVFGLLVWLVIHFGH